MVNSPPFERFLW